MADHLDSPSVQIDPSIDITDVYVFHPGPSGKQNLDNTVLVLNVNPLTPKGQDASFATDAIYTMDLDTNGDAKEDISYRVFFSDTDNRGSQRITVRLADTIGELNRPQGGKIIARGRTNRIVDVAGGGKLYAGLRDDPFFFDLEAFLGLHKFREEGKVRDFFAGTNITAIVLEVPTRSLGFPRTNIGYWATVHVLNENNDTYQQIDRMGRPAIATVFVPKAKKDAFNAASPSNDQKDYLADVVAGLRALDSRTAEADATGLAKVLLPDVLTADVSKPTAFLNGRNLEDDVIDAELKLITGAAWNREPLLTGDGVDKNDKDFPGTFPYLAAPHK